MRTLALAALGAALGALVLLELETSRWQSAALARYAAGIEHWVEAGPNPRLRYPEPGPFDWRAGYAALSDIVPRLEQRGFEVTAQARVSSGFEQALDDGLFPIYTEKLQTGLVILSRDGRPLFSYAYPERALPDFDSVPPLLVRTLLHIENRELLDPARPYRNPAVEWDRLAMMTLRLGRRSLGDDGAVQGASTLATQIEKFRHSPGGLTQSPREKLRQMATASVRAYHGGRETLGAQRRIVVDYLNGLPLAALPNHGEIHGLLDGLWLWYGIDGAEVELLREPIADERLQRAGFVYRAALSLMLSTRRPAFYLGRVGSDELERLADAYVRLLEREGVLSSPLARAALNTRLDRRREGALVRRGGLFEQKAASSIRAHLLRELGVESLYRLDRLDLTVTTSIDDRAQTLVGTELRELQDPERRAAAGLTGPRLLPAEGVLPITYSLLLSEATAEGNVVRVQTDSFAGPRDVNRNTKLELGSTAKLRTLISYLEIIEALYEQLAGASPESSASYLAQFDDPLTVWVGGVLEREPDLSLVDLLAIALKRRYSASPNERFFTGGGLHSFSNFDSASDADRPTVQEALSQSINLSFIRLMRDVVRYHEHRVPFARGLIADVRHPLRTAYLARFAQQEGEQFIRRFHARHAVLTAEASVERLAGSGAASPLRIARIYLAIVPQASAAELGSLLAARPGASPLPKDEIEALHERVRSERYPLADRAYLAGVHPLELWVAQHLALNPGASLARTIEAGDAALQEAYRWLFRTSRKSLQDARIRTVLEAEAFDGIHAGWRRLGYPFPFLVPSYATAIGSSGDSPEALAELVGVLVNDGIRRPTVQVTGLRFAEHTPFETHLRREAVSGNRVLSAAIAQVAKAALADVIENGTGRRVRDLFFAADGSPLPVGGKTGTGDNRHVVVDWRGGRVAAFARSRTAALVFFVGNHFGVVTAHVDGAAADDFTFTSALPAQLLRYVAPSLEPLVQGEDLVTSLAPAAPRTRYAF